MKKILLLAALVTFPVSAQADFSMIGFNKAESTSAPKRSVKKPALQVINDRYVPDEIQRKYQAPVQAPVQAPMIGQTAPTVMDLPVPAAGSVATPMSEPVPLAGVAPIMDAPKEVAAMPAMKSIVVSPPKALIIEDAHKATPALPLPDERHETWRARKGEYVKEVLKRWSDRSETEFVWTASRSPRVTNEFSFVGTFQDAATKLLAQSPEGLKTKFADDVNEAVNPMANNIPTGPQPLPTPIINDQINYTDVAPVAPIAAPVTPMSPVVAPPETPAMPEPQVVAAKDWTASQGSSLEAVLKGWADKEGAQVVWHAGPGPFEVKKPINQTGEFEVAVLEVLSQFDAQKTRPVGQLYKNPISGEKVLVIRQDK